MFQVSGFMKKTDIIFSSICGLAVAWIVDDFFGGLVNGYLRWIFFLILPALSIIGLWLANLIGKKILFVKQAGKFALAGAFADVIDIKVFQFLFFLAPFSLFFKGVSFLIATAIKYWTNKHWAFQGDISRKPDIQEKGHRGTEAVKFFLVTLIGLAINVVSFYYFTKIKIGMPTKLWVELSIIFAALTAAMWNFLGYKFIVFKK